MDGQGLALDNTGFLWAAISSAREVCTLSNVGGVAIRQYAFIKRHACSTGEQRLLPPVPLPLLLDGLLTSYLPSGIALRPQIVMS